MSTRRDRAAQAIIGLAIDRGFAGDLSTRELYRLADKMLAEVDRVPDISELIDGGAASPPADPTGASAVADGSGQAAESATAKAAPPSVLPRPFLLFRKKDVTGKSGVGVIAWGTEWPDKTASLRWATAHPSTVAWPSVEDILAVHGHDGATVIHWLDQPEVSA